MRTDFYQSSSPSSHEPRVRAAHRTASILVTAFAASLVMSTLLGLIFVRDELAESRLPIPFYAATVFLALGSIAFRRTQLRSLRLQVVAGLRGVEGLVKHLVQVTVVSAALGEAIGLLALLVAFFGGDRNHVLTLGVVGLLVVFYNFPRRAAWQKTIDYFASQAPGR